MSGNFFYYTEEQLSTGKLVDNNSILFVDKNYIDLDTLEDWKKAEEYLLGREK